jgi:hypothetical protein
VMIFLWLIVSASLCVAFLAWSQARRTAAQLSQLSEMYWELRYQHGELRVQMQRASGETPTSASVGESFVPLSSLKR